MQKQWSKQNYVGSNWFNCINRVRVILAGGGQFNITPLDFLLVLQLIVVGEEAHSKVDVDAHLRVNKLKIDNTKRKIKKTLDSHRERQRRQHERLADAANNSKNEDSDDVEDHEEHGEDEHQARFLQASPQDAQ